MSFKKENRSYCTPNGWRLATFEEAINGLEVIKEPGFLNKWDRVRLLDGWILGPGFDFQKGNNFRGCLGHMLLVQTQSPDSFTSGRAYVDVNLSDYGKEVALFLCVDDWNYEVVYWLLNSWSKSENMDLADLREGTIRFCEAAEFAEMSNMIGYVARRLGEEGGVGWEEAGERNYSGRVSLKNVLAGMIKFLKQDENIQLFTKEAFQRYGVFNYDQYSPPKAVGAGDSTSTFWSFVCENFAGYAVEVCSHTCLEQIVNMNSKSTLNKNIIVATSILLYLSAARSDIIHAPLAHHCSNSCAQKILCYLADKAEGHPQLFQQMLQNNPMWRCYDETDNYDILDKLLIHVIQGYYMGCIEEDKKIHILTVNRLLKCGAKPQTRHGIDGETALISAAISPFQDLGIEVAKSLFMCNEKTRIDIANATDGRRRSALHMASEKGYAGMCQLLLDYAAPWNGQDQDGKTALHYAVEERNDEVINVFMRNPHIITELTDLKDKRGSSPLDIAVADRDVKLITKLLSHSNHVEAYFNQLDLKQLLRYSLMYGYVNIVSKLLQSGEKLSHGDCDEEGKTVFHLAAICDNHNNANQIFKIVREQETSEKVYNLLKMRDRRGKTVLHEAALSGNATLCNDLLDINPKVIYMKDRDGRNPLYDAVKAKEDEVADDVFSILLDVYLQKDMPVDDLIDRSGLTPLHVAASEGKTERVRALLGSSKIKKNYLHKGDILGQTALLKAAKSGDSDTVEILLNYGAQPLKERDCDGRTALHYAVQANTKGDKTQLVNFILEECKSDEERLLLLWATAAGLGTADQNVSDRDPLHKFLVDRKEGIAKKVGTGNLLKTAACVGDIVMTKELIIRGYPIGDIHDPQWKGDLTKSNKANVDSVSRRIEKISEQANDQPTISDNLGRLDYAQGLAALLLNPYLKPPITVGISGSWGMGKSSLMVQTESILLTTAAQMALLPSSKLSKSALELPGIKGFVLSKKGEKEYKKIEREINKEIERKTNYRQKINGNMFVRFLVSKIPSSLKKSDNQEDETEDGHKQKTTLPDFLSEYDVKYHMIFKSLAAMDSNHMFTTEGREEDESQPSRLKTLWIMVLNFRTEFLRRLKSNASKSKTNASELRVNISRERNVRAAPKAKSNAQHSQENLWRVETLAKPNAEQSNSYLSGEGNAPGVLTVQFNAWKYRNEIEALAGMAVEITKEIEGTMSKAQWLNTCWRNTLKHYKYSILFKIIFPCLLTIALAFSITLILWILLDRSESKEWAKAKYACLPVSLVITAWTLTKSVMGIVKPVSTQLMNYISFPDHSNKLGYQDRVISDITFLKDEIGKRPHWLFIVFAEVFTVLWNLFTKSWVTSLFFNSSCLQESKEVLKVAPASGKNLRIIVFLDDLDRCNESVILQVLSAINLVLAVCQISVVLGMDKKLIDRAIIKKYGNVKANKSSKSSEELADMYLQKIIQLPLDLPDPSEEQSMRFLKGQLGVFEEETKDDEGRIAHSRRFLETQSDEFEERDAHSRNFIPVRAERPQREAAQQNTEAPELAINMALSEITELDETSSGGSESAQTEKEAHLQKNTHTNMTSIKESSSSFLIREMLFVRYSQGEQDAFCHFQKLATECRKLPREWKRLLNYHRLVWYIFSLSKEAKVLLGWQVQLITWIFICWEWKENMNFIIENWSKFFVVETPESNPPSLLMIVEHCMEDERNKNMEMNVTSGEGEGCDVECSRSEAERSQEAVEDKKVIIPKSGGDITKSTDDIEYREKVMSEKLDALEKILVELKTEFKELKELVSDELKKDINEFKEQVSAELKQDIKQLKEQVSAELKEQVSTELRKDIKELQEQVSDEMKKDITKLEEKIVKKQRGKNDKRKEEWRMKVRNWERMKSALERYDVPMDGIQAFQRFRFYCIAGYLPRPFSTF